MRPKSTSIKIPDTEIESLRMEAQLAASRGNIFTIDPAVFLALVGPDYISDEVNDLEGEIADLRTENEYLRDEINDLEEELRVLTDEAAA